MRQERTLQMAVREILVRGHQEASKWLDRNAGVHACAAGDLHHVTAALPEVVRERGRTRFFESALHPGPTTRLLERMLESSEQIISTASSICRGRFDLLGYRGLNFGDPVDWHLDPVSGRRAPVVHWSLIDSLDPAEAGDTKVIWELNRHQWLLPLGQAYRLTDDERYAEAFAGYVQEWMQANPVGLGINWVSSLEVAFRLISWCWALTLFDGSRALSSDMFAAMLAGIDAHARHVERYLSLYFSPNTHLTGEALGLFYAGVLFPELRLASRWETLGARILVEQCKRQILADGVYFEQSTCYQRYTAEIYLHFLILASRNGVAVPETVGNRLQQLLDFLIAVRHPDGSMPQIGDADGGWVLPLMPRAPDDLRGVISVAAAFFGRPDYAWAAGGLTPEVLWLLGASGAKVFEALAPTPPPIAPSRLFPCGGYAVMRSRWEQDANQLIFDVGPLGCPISGAHGHADLLSIQCSVFGEPYLVDSGTYCYTPHPEWRDYFRSTAAHSTVRVGGHEQAVPTGTFKWQVRPRARLVHWISTETFDFAAAEHDAYASLQSAVRHRRRVLFIKPRYWMVVDDLEGISEHSVELTFQFAPLEVTLEPDLWARARGMGGHALLIRPFATVPLDVRVCMGEAAPIRGWVSPNYGQRTPAPQLVYAASAPLPLRIVTLLFPVQDSLIRPPAVSPEVEGRVGPVGLRFADSGECVRLDPSGPVMERA